MGDHCRGRHRKHRRREREKVSARVHNDFEKENSGEVENFQQAGNALAVKDSHNNKVEQENQSKSEED